MKVEKVVEKDMWWGQVIYSAPKSSARYISHPVFVRAGCKCSAEQKILAVVRIETPDTTSLGMYDSIPGRPGPYQVNISNIEEASSYESEENNCGCNSDATVDKKEATA